MISNFTRAFCAFVLYFCLFCIVGFPRTAEQNNSLLWRVTGKGLAKPSYLFGTIHLICAADFMWTTKMDNSLKECKQVCFELDLDNRETMASAAGGLMDTSGKTLEDYFTVDQYRLLKKFVKDTLGMEIDLFRQMKPIALQSLIEMQSTDCKDATSYEESIMQKALAQKKEITGLEEPADQINLLESLPADSVAAELMDAVTNFAKSRAEYRQLMDAYKSQDINKLYSLMIASGGMGDHLDAFLDDRNRKWMSTIINKMNTDPFFFAVGAGHLPGENGVINLLRKAGYKVEPFN